jgi:hypothetical protein
VVASGAAGAEKEEEEGKGKRRKKRELACRSSDIFKNILFLQF